MGDNTATDRFVLDLDAKKFISESLEAKAAYESIGNAETLTEMTEGFLAAGAAVGALGVALFAWKAAFDAVLDAEKIRMVGAEFDDLTKKAGIFGEDLKKELEESSKGWVGQTELMAHANKALLELQVGFEKLPEIMEIARQRTQVFGGTVLENFDAINQAVATGTTRQLRHLGIIIDQEKAYRDYAASIGVTVGELSLAGRQQAVMNAMLEDNKKKMFNSHDELMTFTNEWNRFKTQVNEVKEAFILFFQEGVMKVFNGLAGIYHWYSALEDKATQWGIKQLQNLGIVKEVHKGLGDLHQEERKFEEHRVEAARASSVDLEKQKKQRAEYAKAISDLDHQLVQEQSKNLQSLEEGRALYYKSLEQEGEKVQQQIDQVRAKQAAGEITAAQANEEIVRLNKLKAMKMKADDAELWKFEERALDNYVKHSQGSFDAVGRSFKKASAEAQHDIQTGMKFGTTAVTAFSKNATSNIEAWGAGTKSATQAIEGMFAGMAGDMASQYGEMMMLAAVWPPNPPAFAAGTALVALGGFLKSLGGGSSSSTPSGGGASPAAATTATTDFTGPTSQAAVNTQPHKTMQLVIQGHVLSGDQTARWLVDKIRESADVTDFKIQSVGGGL